jgi:hypothetical protein
MLFSTDQLGIDEWIEALSCAHRLRAGLFIKIFSPETPEFLTTV